MRNLFNKKLFLLIIFIEYFIDYFFYIKFEPLNLLFPLNNIFFVSLIKNIKTGFYCTFKIYILYKNVITSQSTVFFH